MSSLSMRPDIIQYLLMFFILPLWLLSATADYFCHRSAQIEKTAGPKETYIHLLGLAQMGIPVLAALFLEINALVLAIMLVCFILHEITTHWDVAYAHSVRDISPIEQHVHNYLTMLPFTALVFIAALHWNQFIALFGLGTEAPRFDLLWKPNPLPWAYIAGILTLIVFIDLMPFMEELARALRAARKARR